MVKFFMDKPYFSIITMLFFIIWIEFFPVSYTFYNQEDRLLENLSAVLFFIASVAFVITAMKSSYLKEANSKLAYFMIISWAILMFVFAGEEISWGQRIFDFGTPDGLNEINLQGEFNIHNIDIVDQFGGGKYRYLTIMMLLTGVVFPLMALHEKGKQFFQIFKYPVLPMHFMLFFLGAYLYGKWYVAWFPADLTDMNAPTEVREFIFGLGMMFHALYGVYKPNALFLAED